MVATSLLLPSNHLICPPAVSGLARAASDFRRARDVVSVAGDRLIQRLAGAPTITPLPDRQFDLPLCLSETIEFRGDDRVPGGFDVAAHWL
jgi:hypothetical protein